MMFNNNVRAAQNVVNDVPTYPSVVKSIVEGRDVFFVREMMEGWFLSLYQRNGGQGNVAEFSRTMKMGLINGGGYEFLDDKGNTPLFWAAFYDRADVVGLLVEEYRFSVNRQNFNGDSPLHFAIKGSSLSSAMKLVQMGANVNVSNLQSEYPMHLATCAGLEYVQLLIERGGNLECEDECGDTPLHWAVREDNSDCINLLINSGANIHHQNEDGESPLMFAEIFGTNINLQPSTYDGSSTPMDVDEAPQMVFPTYSFSADYAPPYQNNHFVFYNEYH
eukprot:TRINITY_DN326_c0_g1_i1.p1 TRINITY_DN326_c0_g1~~TRINITY_DN326_c0_g1_i1.p1  ORF type:complete len:277 (+),score=51.45 TRINITY_DN326_c0_g1_i1:217-1047(+)